MSPAGAEIRFLIPGFGKRRPNTAKKRRLTQRLVDRDGTDCWICGNPIDLSLPREHDEAASIEHVVPFGRGGGNAQSNLRLTHRCCNERRNKFTCDLFKEDTT